MGAIVPFQPFARLSSERIQTNSASCLAGIKKHSNHSVAVLEKLPW